MTGGRRTPAAAQVAVGLALLLVAGCDQKSKPAEDATDDDSDAPFVVPIVLEGSTGTEIPEDGTYAIPDGDDAATTRIFTRAPERLTVRNVSSGAVVLDRIVLDPGTRVMEEEFSLRETADWNSEPLVVDGVIVPEGGTFDFFVHLYPVTGGLRDATVSVDYESIYTYAFTVTGIGAPEDNEFFTDGGPSRHRVLGAASTDEMVAGMAMDDSANTYIAGAATGIVDADADDVLLVRLSPTGDLDWGRIWYSSYTEGHRDAVGPMAGAIVHDEGFIFVAGSTNATALNPESGNIALLMKVEAATGDLSWDRVWTPVDPPTTPSHAARAHAVDVAGDHVYVTGTTGADDGVESSHVFILALDKASGDTVLFQQAIDLAEGLGDRGYGVRATSTGEVVIAGNTETSGFALKITGADTASPAIAWTVRLDLGTGGAVNAVDVDGSGDVYVSCDRADDRFSVVKLAGGDGALSWGTAIVGGTESTIDRSHVVHVTDTSVFAGGIIWLDGYSTELGDGFLVNLVPSTGALEWATFYFTGDGPDEECMHRVQGIGLSGDTLTLAGQVVTGSGNQDRYFGYWYDAPATTESFSPEITTLAPEFFPLAGGTVRDVSSSRTYEDLPDTVVVEDAWDRTGEADDADIFWMTIFI